MSLSPFEKKLLMEFFVTQDENGSCDFPLSSDADLKEQQIFAINKLRASNYILTPTSYLSNPVRITLTYNGKEYIQNY